MLFIALAAEYMREAHLSNNYTSYLDTLSKVPSRSVFAYIFLLFSLFVFRNDFPFNLLILLVSSFVLGRLTSSLTILNIEQLS